MIARRALAAALAGHRLSMVATGTPDRYRRIPAQLFGDGVWIQEIMVRQGWLRVSADQQPGACATPLIAAEHQAIAGRAGHWGNGAFRIRTPDQLANSAGRFEIVEGEVWQVRLMNGTALIEFANASNFQLTVPPVSLREFRDTHFDIRRLRGRVIRVRGWISLDRQPTMAIANPALIEIRDGPPARRR